MSPTALVSGSESGIGASLVRKLVQDGYDVVMACKDVEAGQRSTVKFSRSSQVNSTVRSHRKRTAGSVAGKGRVLRILPLDLADPQSVHGLIRVVGQEMDQQIDVLVSSSQGSSASSIFLALKLAQTLKRLHWKLLRR
eukprot:465389-Pelagomonas_calceolata.AAC.1